MAREAGPPAGTQPTGPGGLGDPDSEATLRICAQVTEVRVQVDLLGACSNVVWKPEMLFLWLEPAVFGVSVGAVR